MAISFVATEGPQWSDQRSSRDGAKVDRFIVHHAANTSVDATLNLFAGARQVSAHYALGNGRVVPAVPESDRAWTSGSYEDDRRAITVEVSNSRAGDPWPVADIEFENLARLIADVATRYGFPIDDDHVLTHQELWTRFGRSYPTACPGDLQRRKGELLELARKFQAPAPTPLEGVMKDLELIRWNGHHVFAVGNERVFHVENPQVLETVKIILEQPVMREFDNNGMEYTLQMSGLSWDIINAVLRGWGNGYGGRYWSRTIAEGEASRGAQKKAQLTIDDVLKTAKTIESASR